MTEVRVQALQTPMWVCNCGWMTDEPEEVGKDGRVLPPRSFRTHVWNDRNLDGTHWVVASLQTQLVDQTTITVRWVTDDIRFDG